MYFCLKAIYPMKNTRFLSLMAMLLIMAGFIASCGSPEGRLPGTWVTVSATADIDSTKATVNTYTVVDNALESARTTRFVLNEDHSMALSIDGFESDAFWAYDEETEVVSFRFEMEATGDAIELGKLDGSQIIYTSKVKNGTITTIYEKE